MGDMAAELEVRYGEMSTEGLLELRTRRADLTDVAVKALELTLRKRGVDESAIAAEESRRQVATERRTTRVSNLAPLSSRLIAYLVDVPGSLVALAVVNFPVFLYTPKQLSDAVGLGSIVVWMLYAMFKDGFNGQSLGKRLLGIQVIEMQSGEPCEPLRSLIRNLCHSMGLVDWVFALGMEQRRLGDLAANTCVVRK
jgi:uncharacterized RDD family membrane protein YckC